MNGLLEHLRGKACGFGGITIYDTRCLLHTGGFGLLTHSLA